MISTFIFELDSLISSNIYKIQSPKFSEFMIQVNDITENLFFLGAIITIVIIILSASKRWKNIFFFLATLLSAELIELFLKDFIKRPRPENALIFNTDYSFPSGHAVLSTVFCLLLIILFKDKFRNPISKNIFIFLNIFVILFLSFNRIYLSVHYLSDVIGGILIGTIWVILAYLIFNYVKKHYSKNN